MPITFRCAACAKVLRVPDTMAGRKGKCPKCDAILHVPTESEDETQARPASPGRTPRPSPASIVEEKALPPRRRIDEANDDDFADAPEEGASRPRKKPKKKQRGMSTALLVGLLAGGFGLLLLCSGVGGLTWWYFSSSGSGEDLKYMPNNCQMIVSIHNDQIVQSAAFRELQLAIPAVEKNKLSDLRKEIGISVEDIERVFLGIGSSEKEVVMVVRSKKPIEVQEIISKVSNGNYSQSKVGKYVVHSSQDPANPSFCVLEKTRLLVGHKDTLHSVVLRDKKPDFTKNMEAAMNCVDFSNSLAIAVDVQAARSRSEIQRGLKLVGGAGQALTGLDKINAGGIQLQFGVDIRYDLALLCQDATSASDLKKVVDGFLTMGRNFPLAPKEMKDLMELNLKVEANKLTGYNTIKVGPLINLSKQMQLKQ